MGWVMLFVGMFLPLFLGGVLFRRFHTDLMLTVLGLIGMPIMIWTASLGAKIGPCDVPSCMSSSEHSRFVFGIVALVLLIVAFVLLARGMKMAGGIFVVLADLVGAFSVIKTDTPSTVAFLLLAAGAGAYLYYGWSTGRPGPTVQDYPPIA